MAAFNPSPNISLHASCQYQCNTNFSLFMIYHKNKKNTINSLIVQTILPFQVKGRGGVILLPSVQPSRINIVSGY